MLIPLITILSLPFTARTASPVRLCEIEWSTPGTVPVAGAVAAGVVKQATLIVRARALAVDTTATKGSRQVRFEVEEVLKTSTASPPSILAIRGSLTAQDDFNKRPVPYDQVRPSGLRGSCYAESYRVGADYLLILDEETPGIFTPYWAPLLPTNEQLHGTDDPWLAWVRTRVAADAGIGRPPEL